MSMKDRKADAFIYAALVGVFLSCAVYFGSHIKTGKDTCAMYGFTILHSVGAWLSACAALVNAQEYFDEKNQRQKGS